MFAYYNEIDPGAAQWLRNLIKRNLIMPGHVDERSILDVKPEDLKEFTQCHFFAGIGVWSYALRQAGWPDQRQVWTGSCPCQPFSSAGKQSGFNDERHLWPVWAKLIDERRPATLFGEQVASKDAEPWIELVHADLEAMGYTVGACAFPSAGVGAPHIRDRLYWVGNANSEGLEGHGRNVNHRHEPRRERKITSGSVTPTSATNWMADTCNDGCLEAGERVCENERDGSFGNYVIPSRTANPSPTNGFWRASDWLYCRDNKWRPVEPGTFPLAHGAASRVVRLRAYGNAINAEAAKVFIESTIGAIRDFYDDF